MLNFLNTKKIFIDFDGVIVDSNNLKEISIKESVYKIVGNNRKSNQALTFFNENAGIPRDQKLSLFFSNKDKNKILNLYSSKCHEFYNTKKPTIGTHEFLSFIKNKYANISLFVLSGGEKDEIEIFMKKNNLIHYFDDILASSKLKSNHLIEQKATTSDFLIGDSKSDLKMALDYPLNFILINGYQSKLSKPSHEDLKNISIVSPNLFNLIDFL